MYTNQMLELKACFTRYHNLPRLLSTCWLFVFFSFSLWLHFGSLSIHVSNQFQHHLCEENEDFWDKSGNIIYYSVMKCKQLNAHISDKRVQIHCTSVLCKINTHTQTKTKSIQLNFYNSKKKIQAKAFNLHLFYIFWLLFIKYLMGKPYNEIYTTKKTAFN